jgi:hypothetical protein
VFIFAGLEARLTGLLENRGDPVVTRALTATDATPDTRL